MGDTLFNAQKWNVLKQLQKPSCLTMQGNVWEACACVTNLYEWLGIGKHEGVQALMRMSGVDEAYITGGASDYDKLQALTAVYPLWIKHPYAYALQKLFLVFCDTDVPGDEQELARAWTNTAHRLLTQDIDPQELLQAFGYDRYAYVTQDQPPKKGDTLTPAWVGVDVTGFVRSNRKRTMPADIQPPQAMEMLESELLSTLQGYTWREGDMVVVDLSRMTSFRRPHPYTAGQIYLKFCGGEAVTQEEQDILSAQMMRALSRYAKKKQIPLVLLHVTPQVYTAMTSYLASCEGDAPMICVAYDADTASDLAQCSASVMLGVDLCATWRQVTDTLDILASKMPLGCLAGLYLPVSHWLDVPLVARIEAWTRDFIKTK